MSPHRHPYPLNFFKKLLSLVDILPIVQQANLPNLEVLDKLMRYQTSLNNQLSKQMGELIELEKRYAQND